MLRHTTLLSPLPLLALFVFLLALVGQARPTETWGGATATVSTQPATAAPAPISPLPTAGSR